METWILLSSVGLICLVQYLLLRRFQRLSSEIAEVWQEIMNSLVKEWNKVTQTINTLVYEGIPDAQSRSEAFSEPSEGLGSGESAISPQKRRLYEQRRKAGKQ